MRHTLVRLVSFLALAWLVSVAALGQGTPNDTDESAYKPSTLAKILGGTARSQNDEAELVGPDEWYSTTANFTGRKRPPSGRNRPIIGAWVSSRGQDASTTDLYFSGDLSELEFEQGGRRYWVMAGLPGGLGFDVYPAGQKLTIYLQRLGFSSGAPVAVMTMAKLPAGVTSTTPAAQLRSGSGRVIQNARLGEGERRQQATYKSGSATVKYAGREYTFPLDLTGRHSIAPGLYSWENGVRASLLEFGADPDNYLLLRVPREEGDGDSLVPYLVLNGRIVPPLDISACKVSSRHESRSVQGSVDCSEVQRAVLSGLRFNVE